MFSKLINCLLSALLFIFLILPPSVNAANEFSASYDVDYSVNLDGTTDVTQDIKLKNLTDKFFPSSFTLILPGSEITDVKASDSQGNLEVTTTTEDKNTKIVVKFTNQQIIGVGKEYSWKLSFKDKQIARSLGKVWNINIPKISQQTPVENLAVTLSVPVALGDPDFITHQPAKVNESGGRVNLTFDKRELSNSGLSAIFGQNLLFNFELTYNLKNNSIFPKYQKIALPSDTAYQKTVIEKIEPKPENTESDGFGNNYALFKLDSGAELEVKVSGQVQTFLNSLYKETLSKNDEKILLEETKYWDSKNPSIKTKLSEILADKNFQTNKEKAESIDKFVSNFLQFNYQRLGNNEFTRFGSVTALNNPEKALSAEFVDLELALLRGAGIPARQVIGFALKNQDTKPFAFGGRVLHTWVEFYDPGQGWVISDPTWENTTKGADLFNFNDLNHITLANLGEEEELNLPSDVKVELFDGEIVEKKVADLNIEVSKEILSGFPSRVRIRISNIGNVAFPESKLQINTSKILLETPNSQPSLEKTIDIPKIPPFSNLEYIFNLKTGAIWHSYQDVLQVNFAGVSDTRVITVVPILSYKIFAIEIFGALAIIFLFYIVIILLHHRSAKNH